jgi:hypothetical protein
MQKPRMRCDRTTGVVFNQETCMSQPKTPAPRQTPPKLNRRTLFAGASTVGALAAVATVLPKAADRSTPSVVSKPAPERGGGYSLTEHVKQYYKTTMI